MVMFHGFPMKHVVIFYSFPIENGDFPLFFCMFTEGQPQLQWCQEDVSSPTQRTLSDVEATPGLMAKRNGGGEGGEYFI